MMPCSISKEVFAQLEKMMKSIDDGILHLYRKWVDTIGEDVISRLNRPLMCKSKTRPGHLECNIDRSILDIYNEANYWAYLNYEIPMYVKSLFQKQEMIQFMYQCVLNVVLEYNKIISSLSDDERLLFKPLIASVEKKISPGLSKLTWSAEVGDEYIADCGNTTAELQAFLDDYKISNAKIVAICEKMCDNTLLNLKANYAYDIQELIEELATSMETVGTHLISQYQSIIEFIVFVFEGFELYMNMMADEWIKYINNFDRLIEEALKISCRASLSIMYEALHGDGTTEPNPLLKLNANLIDNRIRFKPSLAEVAACVSNIHNSLVEALRALPRLNDKFKVADINFKPYSEIIAEDEKCIELQGLLNEEVKVNVDKIKEYMKYWEPFRDLWEVDKNKFIIRYEKEDPSAMLFDSNIARYTEMANNVNIQETVSAVHFMQINCADLKAAIIAHCIEWQEKLCSLLYKMTELKIKDFYQYIKLNGEDIMREPQNLEDMQNSINLFELLKEEIALREEMFPQMKEQILTLDKYNVPVTDQIRNLEKNIPNEWANYLELLDTAEKMIDYAKVLLQDAKN